MGRSGYETTNFGDARSPRLAGVGVIAPVSPKGKGKERAGDAPSGQASAAGTDPNPHEPLPPVKRSSDFREAVIEPFPELPPNLHNRRRSMFGLDVGPRSYGPALVSRGSFGARTESRRPRASEFSGTQAGGSSSDPIDVEMGGTDSSPSSPPSPTGSVRTVIGDNDDDGLKTPRASNFAVPEYEFQPSRLAQRLHQEHGYGNVPKYPNQSAHATYPESNVYQYPSQFTSNPQPPPPPPGKILRSQASQFPDGYMPDTNINHGTRLSDVDRARLAFKKTVKKFTSGKSSSGNTFTGGYDFGGSSTSSSSQSFGGMSTIPRQPQTPTGFPPNYQGMMAGTVTPRASELGPPPGFGYSDTGYNTNTGFTNPRGSHARSQAEIYGRQPGTSASASTGTDDVWDSYFDIPPAPARELTQAEKDRRRKAALDAGFEELKRKKQRTRW
ncbi:hypothetical protein B0T20DRAFT_510623 [Sordaria brevicollis]|uniref:Uncharacterized protein n=1 Tax=Sordaria brevicollis TaxID=83679 RepID=A0AAE0P0Z2_SORBR|nr:hypothetical protein B0T20DRAFT_510623 [Sordaria brevicollis]